MSIVLKSKWLGIEQFKDELLSIEKRYALSNKKSVDVMSAAKDKGLINALLKQDLTEETKEYILELKSLTDGNSDKFRNKINQDMDNVLNDLDYKRDKMKKDAILGIITWGFIFLLVTTGNCLGGVPWQGWLLTIISGAFLWGAISSLRST